MNSWQKLFTKHHSLRFVVYFDHSKPSTYSVNTQSALRWLFWFSSLILVLGMGTLLFFRELELHRTSQEELLYFKTLYKTKANFKNNLIAQKTAMNLEAENTSALLFKNNADFGSKKISMKLQNIELQIDKSNCKINITIINQNLEDLQVEGALLVVVETEPYQYVVNPNQPIELSKFYYYYPTQTLAHKNWNVNAIHEYTKKSFKFSRLLKTEYSFEINPNYNFQKAYVHLFDKNNQIIDSQIKTK